MPLVRTIRNRGATVTVEAHGEVLFAPGGPVNNWHRRLTQRAAAATRAAAPTNKRPRWAHYGKPLKATIKATSRSRQGRNKFHLYGAVGSTAPHAVYVDQGTGIHGGSGPYPAKILPPWTHGGASLYESTWSPTGPGGRRVAPVMIQGQVGQHFFDKGLAAAFKSMRMRSFQLPGEGVSGMTGILNSATSTLPNFLGNTQASPAFIGQLNLWRKWRDDAWDNYEGLGRGGGIGSRMHARAVAEAQAAREAALADQGKGRQAYLASKAAAERRRQKQISDIRAAEKRKAEAKRLKAEKDAKRAEEDAKSLAKRNLKQGNKQMERTAIEFFRLIKMQYPDARFARTTLDDGAILFQVRYTGPGGQVITEKWAYGYTD